MNPSSHPVTSDDLNAYIDGTLDPATRSRVEAGLANNPALAEELAELQAVRRALASLPGYRPTRSFTLGADHARQESGRAASTPGTVVRLLPIVRALSVAAVLLFLVVGGSMFLDMNTGTLGDPSATFERQNAIMSANGETEEHAEASNDAEDAPESEAAAPAAESDDHDGSSMTERGDAASAGDEPLDDLQDPESAAAVDDSEEQTSVSSPLASTENNDYTSWKWVSVAFGGLAVALAALWFALAMTGRQASSRES